MRMPRVTTHFYGLLNSIPKLNLQFGILHDIYKDAGASSTEGH